MLLPLPDPVVPTAQTLEEVILEFFDRVRQSPTLDAVNIAAGIAAEVLRQLGT